MKAKGGSQKWAWMLLVAFICMVFVQGAQAADAMYRANPQHTGVYDNGGITPTNTEQWRFATGSRVVSSPAVSDGVIYFGSYDYNVYALDAATGKVKWQFATGSNVASSPAVVNGIAYIGSFDHNVYALDAMTGKEKWRFTTGGGVYSSPAVSGGIVYIASWDGKIYAIDAVTGKERWQFVTGRVEPSMFLPSPTVSGGVVYVASFDGNVYALDAVTGKEKWRFAQNWILETSPAVSGGIVYVGLGNNLSAIDAVTGKERWRFALDGTIIMSSPAVSGGVVYVGSFDHNVYAIDAGTGKEKWRFATGYVIMSSPAVSGGVVYVGSNDGNIYALDAATGKEKWRFATGNSVESSPAVSGGVVYVGSDDNSVYAIGAVTPIPQVHNFTGSWTMGGPDGIWGFGNCMALRQSGTQVSGNYTHEQGMVTGTVSGNILSGVWAEAPTYTGSTDSGKFAVTLSTDGNAFSGTWGYGSSSTGYSFTGTRTSSICPVPTQTSLSVTGITPSTAQNSGPVGIIDLSGSGFPQTVSVKLTRPGSLAITASGITVVSQSKITCNFDLTGKDAGTWDVVVTKPDGQAATLPNGFTITAQSGAILTVSSYPAGADLFIDGVQRGTTPATFNDILPGAHSVTITKPGYYGYYSDFSVTAGQPSTVDVTLQPLPSGNGIISVRSNPAGASIVLDGAATGKTTPHDFPDIVPGYHTLALSMPEYTTYTKTVTVDSGATVTVTAQLTYQPKDGVVFISSVPTGASIYIDDQPKGITDTSLHLKAGTYILKLSKEKYEDNVSVFSIGSGDAIHLNKTLKAPGFECVLAVISLITVCYLIRKRQN